MSRYAPEGVGKEVKSDGPASVRNCAAYQVAVSSVCVWGGGCARVNLSPSPALNKKGHFQGHCAFKGTFSPCLSVPPRSRA